MRGGNRVQSNRPVFARTKFPIRPIPDVLTSMGLMEWLLPSLRGWPQTSGLVSRGIRGNPEGANGLQLRPLLADESTGAARAGVADRRRNETRGSRSSMPDALPGTEFAKGVLPEADSGEFSDD